MAAAVFVAVLFISATAIREFYDPSRLTSWNEQLRYVIGAWCGTSPDGERGVRLGGRKGAFAGNHHSWRSAASAC